MLLSAASGSDVKATSSSSCLRHCLRHTLRVSLFICIIFLLVDATPQFLDEDLTDLDELALPEKRPARLSYFRAPYRGYSTGRYESNGLYGYGSRSYRGGYGNYDWWRKKAVDRYYNRMPWETLPNTNCIRKSCRSDSDCCRRYSKCNQQARVCYDCWYGHPCSSNKDCCERYPRCNLLLNTCAN